jgi:methyl-accepting chemotaxis protein
METLKVGTRITVLIVGGVITMMLAILVGIRGIAQSNANLEALYHQRLESENRKVLYDEAMSNYAGSRNLMLGLGGFAILFASGLGIAICRSVTRPLKHAVGVSCNIAAGRLDNAIEVTGSNELTEMMAALRSMQATLREQIEAERRTAAENLRVPTCCQDGRCEMPRPRPSPTSAEKSAPAGRHDRSPARQTRARSPLWCSPTNRSPGPSSDHPI